MTRNALFAASALALSLLGGIAVAADPEAAPPRPLQLDANQDGAVDRAEAAASPRLAARFGEIDRNADGRITAGEHPRHGRHGRGKGRGMDLARLDADKDGRLSRAEIGERGRLAGHFDAVDGNRDGYLVRTEVRAWHAAQRPKLAAERSQRFEAMFKAADLNGDGKLGRVEVDGKMPHMAARFAWMDDNRDGFLSRAELKPAHRR